MNRYSLSHLADRTLLATNKRLRGVDRTTTADLLAHIAETDKRKLYLPEGYPSLFLYCVHELGFSDDEAGKRVHAARAARRFPMIFPALADGRLHLTAVNRLHPHMTKANATELIAGASHKTKAQVEQYLAERFPKADVATRVRELVTKTPAVASDVNSGVENTAKALPLALNADPASTATTAPDDSTQHVPEHVEPSVHPQPASTQLAPVPEHVEPKVPVEHVPEHVRPTTERSRVTPLAPKRFGLQLTMSETVHDKLRRAQALLGHRVPPNDVAQVLDLALDALLAKLEKQKFAKTDRPRKPAGKRSSNPRYFPAAVRRAVWERDQGRCTFVSPTGHRCTATDVEFDHIDPVARGGQPSVSRLRLLCRAHNQYAAECDYGVEFMNRMRTRSAPSIGPAH